MDEVTYSLGTERPPRRDGAAAALARIAEESERLRDLARAEGFDMLDYLIGMVVLEASDQQRRRARVAAD